MEQLRNLSLQILDVVLQSPATPEHRWILAALAVIVSAFVFNKVCERLDLPNIGMFNGVLLTGLGFGLIVVGMAAGSIYLPDLKAQFGEMAFYGAVTAVVSVAVIVPLINMYIHGKFVGTLAAWSINLLTAILFISFSGVVLDAVKAGERTFERGRAHNEATKQLIK